MAIVQTGGSLLSGVFLPITVTPPTEYEKNEAQVRRRIENAVDMIKKLPKNPEFPFMKAIGLLQKGAGKAMENLPGPDIQSTQDLSRRILEISNKFAQIIAPLKTLQNELQQQIRPLADGWVETEIRSQKRNLNVKADELEQLNQNSHRGLTESVRAHSSQKTLEIFIAEDTNSPESAALYKMELSSLNEQWVDLCASSIEGTALIGLMTSLFDSVTRLSTLSATAKTNRSFFREQLENISNIEMDKESLTARANSVQRETSDIARLLPQVNGTLEKMQELNTSLQIKIADIRSQLPEASRDRFEAALQDVQYAPANISKDLFDAWKTLVLNHWNSEQTMTLLSNCHELCVAIESLKAETTRQAQHSGEIEPEKQAVQIQSMQNRLENIKTAFQKKIKNLDKASEKFETCLTASESSQEKRQALLKHVVLLEGTADGKLKDFNSQFDEECKIFFKQVTKVKSIVNKGFEDLEAYFEAAKRPKVTETAVPAIEPIAETAQAGGFFSTLGNVFSFSWTSS
ncbi:MAG: hypothetical protein WCF65_06145 [Parachlamydiaceae bacterium]